MQCGYSQLVEYLFNTIDNIQHFYQIRRNIFYISIFTGIAKKDEMKLSKNMPSNNLINELCSVKALLLQISTFLCKQI